MNQDITTYYHDRAKEYDRVYEIAAEQEDLREAVALFRALFSGKTVLEIACGTGYWTERMSESASSILATDVNQAVVDIARERCAAANVSFEVADMHSLEPGKSFDALFGGFIWSHILLQDLDEFLLKIARLLKPGAVIAFIDSRPVSGGVHDRSRIVETDNLGNTYQVRTLENGAVHLVLKNFPTRERVSRSLSNIAADIRYVELDHYWIASCKLTNDAVNGDDQIASTS